MRERGAAAIVREWKLTPNLVLRAHERGVSLVIVEESVLAEAPRPRHPMSDAPDLEVYAATLTTARAWRAAVYPPVARGAYPAVMRARIFDDLENAGVLADAAMVTSYLDDWHDQQRTSGHGITEYLPVWLTGQGLR